jgi:hypothetical protein
VIRSWNGVNSRQSRAIIGCNLSKHVIFVHHLHRLSSRAPLNSKKIKRLSDKVTTVLFFPLINNGVVAQCDCVNCRVHFCTPQTEYCGVKRTSPSYCDIIQSQQWCNQIGVSYRTEIRNSCGDAQIMLTKRN